MNKKKGRKEYAGICIHTTPTVLLLFYLLLMLAGLNKGLCGLMEDTGPAFFSNVQVLLNVPLYVLYALYRSSKREHRILWESRKFLLYLATGWFVKSIVKLKVYVVMLLVPCGDVWKEKLLEILWLYQLINPKLSRFTVSVILNFWEKPFVSKVTVHLSAKHVIHFGNMVSISLSVWKGNGRSRVYSKSL